jgi:3-isopropylmalate/(R)-2-methylmalate dehydratase small subunit
MDAFCRLNGLVVPLDRSNVDTDAIIPKQFLKSIKRTGFGPNLFDEWRYLDHGELGMDCSKRPLKTNFVLNQPRYQGAEVLLTRDNFGCGSSREHAPWALFDYGFRAVIAPSFAEIFANNCCKNSILPVVLPTETVARLFDEVDATPGYRLIVDLEKQQVVTPSGETFEFAVDAFRKECLLKGLDDISLTLQHVEAIKAFEEKKRADEPWLFGA